jgi:hypothetical protein
MAGEQTYNYIPVRITEKIIKDDSGNILTITDVASNGEITGISDSTAVDNAINNEYNGALKSQLFNGEKGIVKGINNKYTEIIRIGDYFYELGNDKNIIENIELTDEGDVIQGPDGNKTVKFNLSTYENKIESIYIKNNDNPTGQEQEPIDKKVTIDLSSYENVIESVDINSDNSDINIVGKTANIGLLDYVNIIEYVYIKNSANPDGQEQQPVDKKVTIDLTDYENKIESLKYTNASNITNDLNIEGKSITLDLYGLDCYNKINKINIKIGDTTIPAIISNKTANLDISDELDEWYISRLNELLKIEW